MSPSRHRARALASLSVVVGLGLAAAVSTTAPAESVESVAPTGDCAVAFPVDDLAAGDQVTGLTVTHGTAPEGFTGEVLGVLADGIGPDVDMVMVRLTSPEIDRVGIWQGMSGSPVYAADGRLIGAVSYGLALGSSTVAGVTPFAAMDDYLAPATSPAKIDVGPRAARQIASGSDVRVAQAERGFRQLPMPLGVSGVGAARLAAVADRSGDHSWLSRSAYAAGRAGAADTGVSDIMAGGNLAASLTYGDVTMAGLGTVTSVCGDRVVGFGHPLAWLGRTTLGLHPADAIYVQDDLVTGFKVANLGDPVGTITDDRGTGVTGTLGALPETVDLTSSLTYRGRSRAGVTHAALDSPDVLASSAFYGLLANHEAVVDGPLRGSEDVTWRIAGTDATGVPFELGSDDLFTSRSDLTWSLGFTIGDLVYMVTGLPGFTVDTVTVDGVLRDQVSSYTITKVEARQHGDWVKVGRRPLLVRGGGTIAARVTLDHGRSTTVLPTRLEVPKRFSHRMAFLQVAGGGQFRSGRMPRQLDEAADWLDHQVRRDEVVVALTRGRRSVQNVLGPLGGVVRGRASAPVLVQ